MMLGKGEYQDVRVLSRKSVAEMTTNQLTPQQQQGPNAVMFFNNNSGWGLGMAVALRRNQPWLNPGRVGWDGGYGTSAYTDSQAALIGVLMTQRPMDSPAPPPTYTDFWTAAYHGIPPQATPHDATIASIPIMGTVSSFTPTSLVETPPKLSTRLCQINRVVGISRVASSPWTTTCGKPS